MQAQRANRLELGTRKARWYRKLRKLTKNPAAFFRDSGLFRSRVQAELIPSSEIEWSPPDTAPELVVAEVVRSVADLDPQGYLEANPDVRRAGVDPRSHFEQYGKHESRRQYPLKDIEKARSAKMARIRFTRRPVQARPAGLPQNYLSKSIIESFEIPDEPPVSENDYNPEIVELIRANRDKLFLDLGAGLRHTYYSNVVNTEVWPSVSTDVVCVGEDLPFASSQFDFVLCLAVLEHTKRPWLVVKEILRVLKPGGFVRIDWPFLQPVHGYPHHYFNATPKGLMSQFEDDCEIISADVRQWQHPMYTLTWFLQEWRNGLPESQRATLDAMTVADLLEAGIHDLLALPISTELARSTQHVIGAGTTLIARKLDRLQA